MKGLVLALVFSTLAAIALLGCSTELARITFVDVGSAQTVLTLDSAKPVDFWTDLDLTLDEDISLAGSIMADAEFSLAYSIALYQGGELVKGVSCNPFDISYFDISTKFKSIRTSIRATRSFKYLGKMRCSTTLPSSGPTKVEAVLAAVDPTDGSLVAMPETGATASGSRAAAIT
ncbi:MAG: hypothetical protein IIC21_05310 [Chloroflexi bacterium]|nr:hypothetical protein [Chloroflexota bacterium]